MDRLLTEFDKDLDNNPYHIYDMLIETLCILRVISREELDFIFDHLDMPDLIRMFGEDRAFGDG